MKLQETKPLQFNQVTTPSFPIKSNLNLNQNDAFHEGNDGNDTWLRQPSATTFQFANSFHSKELPPSAYKATNTTNGISFTAATNSQMPGTSYSPSNIQPHKLNKDGENIKNMKPTNIRISFDTSPVVPFKPQPHSHSRSTMTSASNSYNNTPLPTTTLTMQNTPTQSRMLLFNNYLIII